MLHAVSSDRGLIKLFDLILPADTASIDTGSGGFSTALDVLLIYGLFRTTEAVVTSSINVTVNGDTGANYDNNMVRNANTTVTGTTGLAQNQWALACFGASADTSNVSMLRAEFFGYGQTTFHKQGRTIMSYVEDTAADSRTDQRSLRWRSTSAISRVAVAAGSGNLLAGSRLAVYAF